MINLRHKNHHPSFAKDLIYYLPSKIIPALFGFLLIIVLTHSLAPSGYGRYAFFLALVRLMDTLLFSWLRQSILRYLQEYNAKGLGAEFERDVSSLFLVVLGIEAVVSLAMIPVMRISFDDALLIIGLFFPITTFGYLSTFCQAKRLSAFYSVSSVIQSGVQMLWVICFVYIARKGYQFALLAIGVGYLSGVIYLIVKGVRPGKFALHFFFSKVKRGLYKALFAYGLPMAGWLLAFQLIFQSNRIFLEKFRSATEVGLFASAYDLINGSLSLLMTPFLLATHPVVMQLWAKDRDKIGIERLLERVSRYLLLFFVPVFFFILVFQEKTFAVLGKGYGVVGWVVPIMVLSSFIAQFSMYTHKGLEVMGRTKTMLTVGVMTVFFHIVLSFIFVKDYGYPACAVISLASYLFYIVIIYGFSKRYIRLRISCSSLCKMCFTAGILSIMMKYGGISGWACKGILETCLVSVVYVLIYGMILLVIGELYEEKRSVVAYFKRSIVRKV